MKRYAALLLTLCLGAPLASANTFSTDMTDLWWNANESGWGVTATHQREIIFLTFFVYGTDNRAIFYTATTAYTGQNGSGALVFSGPMYQSTGPWFGTFFDPNAKTVRQVGTASFTAFVDAATLTYTVDGTAVSKALTRQTFRINDMTGSYAGVFKETYSGCTNTANNGTLEAVLSASISNDASTFAMTTNQNGTLCNWSGDYRQTGRMGASTGSYTCPGVAGTYSMAEIEANPSGITGRYTAQDNVCSQTVGHFAVTKR